MGVKLYNVETIKNRSGKMLFEGLFDSGDIRLLLINRVWADFLQTTGGIGYERG